MIIAETTSGRGRVGPALHVGELLDPKTGLSTRPLFVMGGWVSGVTRREFWMGVGRRAGTHLHACLKWRASGMGNGCLILGA